MRKITEVATLFMCHGVLICGECVSASGDHLVIVRVEIYLLFDLAYVYVVNVYLPIRYMWYEMAPQEDEPEEEEKEAFHSGS